MTSSNVAAVAAAKIADNANLNASWVHLLCAE